MKQSRETSLEERIQIVRECIACGKNYGEMALKYQVSYQQVRTWTLRFEQMAKSAWRTGEADEKRIRFLAPNWNGAQIEIEQLKHKLYLS